MFLIHSYWGSSFQKQQTLQKVVWCYAMHCSELYGQQSLINSREKVNSRKCFPGHCRMFLDSGNCKTKLENWCSWISSDAGTGGAPLERWISGSEIEFTSPARFHEQKSGWWMGNGYSHFKKPCLKHTLWWRCWNQHPIHVQNVHLLSKEIRRTRMSLLMASVKQAPGCCVKWQLIYKGRFQ